MRPTIRFRRGRRRHRAAADFVLEVSTHSRAARRQRQRLLLLWFLRIICIAGIGWGTFYLGQFILNRFFFSNPEYTLRHCDLTLAGVMTREEAIEITGLREGMNIFSVNLSRLEKILSADSMIARVRIERQLPDRLEIEIIPRTPVAWVEIPALDSPEPPIERLPSNGLLIDASGFLMKPRRLTAEHLKLPAISGVSPDLLIVGTRLEHEGLAGALELLLECSQRPELLLRPQRLDVSRGWRIEVLDASGPKLIFGLEDIGHQLDSLQKLLAHCQEAGRTIQTANLMVRRNIPVSFVMNSPPPLSEARERRK